ncbi:MAG: hypothetical protein DRO36_06900 [Candidatus Hecatellales archaeon]|nr:MAG: hypothetical protein DRO36_06900 [Candidatus Hecatellales archaeon]
MATYKDIEVFCGTAADTESSIFELPLGIKHIDIITLDNPLQVKLYIPGRGAPRVIKVPGGKIYPCPVPAYRFTVQNETAGSNAKYCIVCYLGED